MRLRYLLPFMVFFSFVIMIFSGTTILLNSNQPLGQWHFLGLSGEDYVRLNVNFFAIFTTSSFILLIIHWNAFVNYLVTRNMDPVLFRKRFYVTLLITIIFFIGSLGKIPTFGLFSKNSKESVSPPTIIHEPKITKEDEIVEEKSEEKVEKKEEKKEEIEEPKEETNTQTNIEDKDDKEEAKSETKQPIPSIKESELYKQSLKEASKSQDFNLERAISFLKIKGLSNIDEDLNIKEVADRLDMKPQKLIKTFKNHEKIMPN